MLKNRLSIFNNKANWLRQGCLYHRGKHSSVIKENTMDSFEEAVNDGLGIELDVRLSNDNKVVVSHDDSLKRVFGVDKKISELTYKEICDCCNNGVPLLSDVLKLVDGKVGIMVEIKSNKVGLLEEKVYEILKEYKGKFVIVSFNPFSLRYFRKKDSSIIRGQLSYSYKKSKFNWFVKFVLSRMLFNFISKPHFISYGIDDVNYKILKKYKKKGYFVIGWTYNNDCNKEDLLKYYDNMIIEGLELREFK